MISSRQLRWWLLFGAGLLVAMAGWMWIMVRLVQSESEASLARVRQAEEKLLAREAEDLSTGIEAALEPTAPIPDLARSGVYAGWWSAEVTQESDTPALNRSLDVWRKRLREKQVSSVELASAIDQGELAWGWIEDGRDPVAGFLPSLYRQGDRSPELVEMLTERVWDFQPPTLAPAFRLTLIRPLIELAPSDELRRLLEIESIRAAEGRPEDIDGEYEVIESRSGGSIIRSFWTRAQLLRLLGSPEGYGLFESPPEGRAAVPVSGLRRWPYLAAASPLSRSAAQAGSRSLIWIGAASGLALVALALAAVLFGSHQLQLARLRTDLAASVAHELRTPLAGQRLLLETLLESKNQNHEEREEYIAMAFRENKRLSRLAEEFLTFSRLERGVLQFEIEAVDVATVVDGAVESLREKWEDPECELTLSLDENLPQVAGDRQALVTVLRNLLENAWKYSASPRKIEVVATAADEAVLISVSDHGIGLSAKDRQRIFRQFYRVDQRLARSQEGLGLGLSIVKRLLESMHGEIEVSSNQSKGSVFTVRIPILK